MADQVDAATEKKKIFTGELRRDIQIFPGEPDAWGHYCWTLFDPVSDHYFKISDSDHRVLGLLDRNYDVDEFMEKLRINGVKISQPELSHILVFLRNNGLVQVEYGETEVRLEKNREYKKSMFWGLVLNSYLFFRVPLWKPDRFLEDTMDAVSILVNRWMIMLMVMISLGGYISLVPDWYRLAGEVMRSISFDGLLRYSLAIILIKCIHEMAHAYTAKFYGVRVRRMGLAFVVFFPRLYTDMTDAWRINDRRKRFLIDSAGIISEVIIGGIAALVWTNTGPGSVHTIAYYVLTVSAINTVLINGNPFIRYDGYYMLMDIVNIDNMQKRSSDCIRNIFRKYFFGLRSKSDLFAAPWKNHFMVFFGIAGFIYRIFLYTSIIMVVYFQFTKTVGIVLLCLEVYLLIIKPLTMEVKSLMANRKNFNRKNLWFAYLLLGVILLPLIVPLPWSISSPCEIRSAGSAIIYAPCEGYIVAIKGKDGGEVEKDAPIFILDSPSIDWQLRKAVLDRNSLKEEIDQMQSSAETFAPSNVKIQQLNAAVNLIDELKRRRDLLEIKSPVAGRLIFYDDELHVGKYLSRGASIAEVFDPAQLKIVALVAEDDVEHIRVGDSVSVTMENELGTIHGKVAGVNPVPVRYMPASPVLDVFGGPLASHRDGNSFELLQPCYQVVISPDEAPGLFTGRSGSVYFHKYTSIGWKLISKSINIILREIYF